jgi:hypothetical protein
MERKDKGKKDAFYPGPGGNLPKTQPYRLAERAGKAKGV